MNNTIQADMVGFLSLYPWLIVDTVLLFLISSQYRAFNAFAQRTERRFQKIEEQMVDIHYTLKEIVPQFKQLQEDMTKVKGMLTEVIYNFKLTDSRHEEHERRLQRLESLFDENKLKSKQA